jgi:hypothetical protein
VEEGFWVSHGAEALIFLPEWRFGWRSCGVGLSLHCYRSISFAPVRGGTYFLCRRKESRQRKRACNRQPLVSHLGLRPETAQDETCPRTTRASDKALIRSGVALRAPPSGTTPPLQIQLDS